MVVVNACGAAGAALWVNPWRDNDRVWEREGRVSRIFTLFPFPFPLSPFLFVPPPDHFNPAHPIAAASSAVAAPVRG